jgi:hypothetical protein
MPRTSTRHRKKPKAKTRNYVILFGHLVSHEKNGSTVSIKRRLYVFYTRDLRLTQYARGRLVIKIPLYLAKEFGIEHFGVRVVEFVDNYSTQLTLPI